MSRSNPLVSIIIPVYNVRDYLDSCVKSVVAQSYSNIEIILVDDGSQDDSGKRCDAWKNKDRRIKVVHKENAGLNMARFSGFQIATGDYITFLDSDDLFHPDTIKHTVAAALKAKADAVMFQFMEFSDDVEQAGGLSPVLHDKQEVVSSTEAAFSLLIINTYQHFLPMTAWGKLYRRRLVEAVDWRKSNFWAFEDNFFTPQVFDGIQVFVFLHQQLYFYRRNPKRTGVLSKTITGNTLNGEPVGYLEYLCLLRDYWRELLDKHHIGLEDDLQEFWLGSMLARVDDLTKAQALCQENNARYIPQLIDYLLVRHSRDVNRKQAEVARLAARVAELEQITAHLQKTDTELARLKTVRGSIKNAASQVKRHLTKKPS